VTRALAPWVKICGVTTVEQAEACADAGADAIGLNFVPSSKRRVSLPVARAIAVGLKGRVTLVGVVANLGESALRALAREAALDLLQLHGDESPELVRALGALAIKAVRVGGREDLERARRFDGRLLVDALVAGALGGTGARVDIALAAELAKERDVILAGGLDETNVADAVRAVRPWGVDVASGVERGPGDKDLDRVRAFVRNARGAMVRA
jgi:phosphoribosylanthranilate isomerase